MYLRIMTIYNNIIINIEKRIGNMHNTYTVTELSEIFGLKYTTMSRNLARAGLHRYPKTSRLGKYKIYEVGETLFDLDKAETDEYIKEWRDKQND